MPSTPPLPPPELRPATLPRSNDTRIIVTVLLIGAVATVVLALFFGVVIALGADDY